MLRLPWPRVPVKINDLTKALRQQWSRSECEARCKLATAYRLTSLFGWDELIYGHITSRIPDTQHLLINPYGLHYNEITASNLVKIDIEGNVIDSGTSDFLFQQTGYIIHSAIHEQRHDLSTLVHVHSEAGTAVATAVDKLHPVCQNGVYLEPISYHPFEGIVVAEHEKAELAKNFPAPSKCLLMKNHGLLTGGVSIEEAFFLMYMFHSVCKVYVNAGYTHTPVPKEKILPANMIKDSMAACDLQMDRGLGVRDFQALCRQLDLAGWETGYPYASS